MTVKEYLYIALTNSNYRPFLFPPGSNFSTSVLLDASPVAGEAVEKWWVEPLAMLIVALGHLVFLQFSCQPNPISKWPQYFCLE